MISNYISNGVWIFRLVKISKFQDFELDFSSSRCCFTKKKSFQTH